MTKRIDSNSGSEMASIVVIGASGFVGRAILSDCRTHRIKAIVRNLPHDSGGFPGNIFWLEDDLADPIRLASRFEPGDVVINLAYGGKVGAKENMRMIDHITAACRESGATRLVHCSTAVVVGAAKETRITGGTTCFPQTDYEKAKWSIEQRVRDGVSDGLDVGILRPTAVLGPGGLNLAKLARSLKEGSRLINYLRASLYGRRNMHLVPVRVVVDALMLLATWPMPLGGEAHIISADDDPRNNFSDIEQILAHALGVDPCRIPLIPVPAIGLSAALQLMGRSETNPNRYYETSSVLKQSLGQLEPIENAVMQYGKWWLEQRHHIPGTI